MSVLWRISGVSTIEKSAHFGKIYERHRWFCGIPYARAADIFFAAPPTVVRFGAALAVGLARATLPPPPLPGRPCFGLYVVPDQEKPREQRWGGSQFLFIEKCSNVK